MDRAQILNDQEEAMRLMLDGRQVGVWTAIPGIIESVNLEEMTCEVQPTIQAVVVNQDGVENPVNLPLLLDVPIVLPSGGGFLMTLPLAAGDEVLVVFSSRCIDAWWQSGGIQQAMEARMHDLSDGFAIPGPRSIPKTVDTVSSSKLQIRNNAGSVYFQIGTKFAMVNATTNLKTLLSDFESAVDTFMQGIAVLALLPPGTPITNTMLAPLGLTASTSLAAVATKITALLEDS